MGYSGAVTSLCICQLQMHICGRCNTMQLLVEDRPPMSHIAEQHKRTQRKGSRDEQIANMDLGHCQCQRPKSETEYKRTISLCKPGIQELGSKVYLQLLMIFSSSKFVIFGHPSSYVSLGMGNPNGSYLQTPDTDLYTD